MLDDMFKLTIDKIFPPSTSAEEAEQSPGSKKSPYHVSGYRDNFNMWEKIVSLRTKDGPKILTKPIETSSYKSVTRSERLIHMPNSYELRVAKPELLDRIITRDVQALQARKDAKRKK